MSPSFAQFRSGGRRGALKAISGTDVSPQDVESFKVLRWIEDQQAGQAGQKWSLHPIEVRAIYNVGHQYVVETKPAAGHPSEWLCGWIAGPEKQINCGSGSFPTLDAFIDANANDKLPATPAGWTAREVARFPSSPTRMASDGSGKGAYVLAQNGDAWLVELATGKLTPILTGADDIAGGGDALGLAFNSEARQLYVVVNHKNADVKPHLNEVTIYRTSKQSPSQQPACPSLG